MPAEAYALVGAADNSHTNRKQSYFQVIDMGKVTEPAVGEDGEGRSALRRRHLSRDLIGMRGPEWSRQREEHVRWVGGI